ncbi:esterase/lipase family protein, partial [Candidatus Margulisiibacteriota bacterium]
MKITKLIIIIIFVIFSMSSISIALSNNEIDYAKNYLIILVHGVGDDYKCFEKVRNYFIDNGLGSNVSMYQFSDQFLNIEKEGWEFGDRNYKGRPTICNDRPADIKYDVVDSKGASDYWKLTKRADGSVNSWLEQARIDFANNNPGKTVPSKFIIIAHSMGGLAVRSYILGKDQNGQRYYQNDIEKLITIDTPHNGSGAASYVSNTQTLFPHFAAVSGGSFFLAFYHTLSGNDQLAKFYSVLFGYTFISQTVNSAARSVLNRYKTPALQDMKPNSDFLRDLNAKGLGNFDPIKYRLIAGRGLPVPLDISEAGTFGIGLNPISLMLVSAGSILGNPKWESFEERFLGAYFTMLSAYPLFEDGDFTINVSSQLGNGINSLAGAKKYTHTMRCPSFGVLENAIAPGADYFLNFLPPPAKTVAYISLGLAAINYLTEKDNIDMMNFVLTHISMKDMSLSEGLLEKALFEESQPAGSATATAVQQIPLVFSSNLTIEAGTVKTLSTYHPVTPEAMTETVASTSVLPTPVVIDGQEKKIASFNVKEPPTRIEGVLRDFMPLKMQYFQYSENFAAWKDINILNEWGHFQIDGLKLAEGQNMIAFKATSFAD